MKFWEWLKGWFQSEKKDIEAKAIDEMTLLIDPLAGELDKIKATPSISFITMTSKDQSSLIVHKVQDILRKQAGIEVKQ